MRLQIPAGMAPAATVDRISRQWMCRGCSGRRAAVVLVADATHNCSACEQPITSRPRLRETAAPGAVAEPVAEVSA